jgi:hypothetical protein
MDADDDDRQTLIEEFERLQAGQARSEPDIERLFDQAIRWRFGTFISEAIASANVKARHSR